MGEFTDMMLDGLLCAGCGEYIGDDDGEGFGGPTYCSDACRRGYSCEPAPKAKRARARARKKSA